MASEYPRQEINIKDLPTKAVTLYPSRAHIVRDINDVILRPGPNEIEIYGLTPTTDEHSIQIDGRGSATIVDMTVELVPNREIFEEVYPESDDSDREEEEAEYEDSDDEPEEVRTIAAEVKTIQSQIRDASETVQSATRRLESLDQYAQKLQPEHQSPAVVSEILAMHAKERLVAYEARQTASDELAALNKLLARRQSDQRKAGKEERKRKLKVQKEKAKERVREKRKQMERHKESVRVREERLKFWPKSVFRVVVTLETSIDTPGSSRRNSLDSVTIAHDQAPTSVGKEKASGNDTMVSLSLSYVTHEASWSPVYDISISSLTKTATIVYRAEFANCTSETWKDASIVLSTSQTSYQGLTDKVPFMHPWHVRAGRGYASPDSGLLSSAEQNKASYTNTNISKMLNRNELFGRDGGAMKDVKYKKWMMQQENRQGYHNVPAPPPPNQVLKPSMPSAPGSSMASAVATARSKSLANFGSRGSFRRSAPAPDNVAEVPYTSEAIDRILERGEHFRMPSDDEESSIARTAIPEGGAPTIEFEESSWADHGLTATYDMPGTRTLAPSSVTRRHKIASLTAPHVVLSHIAVPKLRAAAFLRAKIKNPSPTVTLLRGAAGVTLDGTFLGNMTLPRVAAGQLFELPLGVDPGVQINYPKPVVRRATQGIFSKETSEIFTRSVWISNTKATPIHLAVLDQVPVSEDERLRIEVVTPRGLSKEGDTVLTGWAAREGVAGAAAGTGAIAAAKPGASRDDKWGKATATFKKEGGIWWNVDLEKGQACILKLDYEARLPTSERIVSA